MTGPMSDGGNNRIVIPPHAFLAVMNSSNVTAVFDAGNIESVFDSDEGRVLVGGIPTDILAMSGAIPDFTDADGLGWWELTPVDPMDADTEYAVWDDIQEEYAA